MCIVLYCTYMYNVHCTLYNLHCAYGINNKDLYMYIVYFTSV